jgi:hypothetical protein
VFYTCTCSLIRRDGVTKDDPSCEHHLYWSDPPERVLAIKKFRDLGVTAKFKELTTWLVKVTIFDLDNYNTIYTYIISMFYSQDCGLKVTVEPSVLLEETIVKDDAYKEVRESLITWDDSKYNERTSYIMNKSSVIIIKLAQEKIMHVHLYLT